MWQRKFLLLTVLLIITLTQADIPAMATPGHLIAKIAVVGDPTPLGGTFGQFIDRPPSLNNLGQLAFDGFINNGNTDRALFFYNGNSLSTLVSNGDVAPGGGIISAISTPALNNTGTIAFMAWVGLEQALLRWSDGSLSTIARTGNPTPLGGTFSTLSALSTGQRSINASGHVVFRARITGGSATEGIFVWDGSNYRTIATSGDSSPVGGTFASFVLLNGNAVGAAPAINDSGDVLFWASLSGGTVAEGIFLKQGNTLTTVVAAGQSTPIGGVYDTFTLNLGGAGPSLNNSGEVAFIAFITGGNADSAIFRWKQGLVTKVVATGEISPLGYTFNCLGTPTLNNKGGLAFRGDSCSYTGIFVERQGILQATVSPFETPPIGGVWGAFGNPIGFNDQGDISFWARGNPWGNGLFMAASSSNVYLPIIFKQTP